MSRRLSKYIIVTIIVLAIVGMSLVAVFTLGDRAKSEDTPNNYYAGMEIETDDGTINDKVTGSNAPEGAMAIASLNDFNVFINSADRVYGYLTNDITVNVDVNANRNLPKGKTFDGNGYSVRIRGNNTSWQTVGDFNDTRITPIAQRYYGFFVGINEGTIKNTVFDVDAVINMDNRKKAAMNFGIISALNYGVITNCKATVSSSSAIKFHKNVEGESNDSNGNGGSGNNVRYNQLNMGVFAGKSYGSINNSTGILNGTIDGNAKYKTANTVVDWGKWGDRCRVSIAIFAGRLESDSNLSDYPISKIDNVIALGGGTISAQSSSDDGRDTLLDAYRHAATIVGSNSEYSGVLKFGQINGVINGFTGNNNNSTSGQSVGNKAVVDCGNASNVYSLGKPSSDNQKLNNCGCSNGIDHYKTYANNIYINNAPNIGNISLNFNADNKTQTELLLKVSTTTGNSKDIIYNVIKQNKSRNGSDNLENTTQQKLHDVDTPSLKGEDLYYNNTIKLVDSFTAYNTNLYDIIVNFGVKGSAVINLPEDGVYTGNAIGSATFSGVNHSGQSITIDPSKYIINGIRNGKVQQLIMPGTYIDVNIEHIDKPSLAYYSDNEYILIPKVTESIVYTIGNASLNINAPNINTWYKEFVFNGSINGAPGAIDAIEYRIGSNLEWTKVNGTSFNVRTTTPLNGRVYRFRGIKYTEGDNYEVVTTITQDYTVKIDGEKPVYTPVTELSEEWSSSSIPYRFKAEDSLSGIASVTVDGYNASKINDAVHGEVYIYSLSSYKDYVIEITDKVGNKTSVTVKPLIDMAKPVFTIEATNAKGTYQAGTPSDSAVKFRIIPDSKDYPSGLKVSVHINGQPTTLPINQLEYIVTGNIIHNVADSYTFVVSTGSGVTSNPISFGNVLVNVNVISINSRSMLMYNEEIFSTDTLIKKIYDGSLYLPDNTFSFNKNHNFYDAQYDDYKIVAKFNSPNAGNGLPITLYTESISGNGTMVFSFTALGALTGNIEKMDVNLNIDNKTKVYGDEIPELTYTVRNAIDDSIVTDNVFNNIILSTDANAQTDAGDNNRIYLANEVNYNNYNIASVIEGNLVITQKKINAWFKDGDKYTKLTYNGIDQKIIVFYYDVDGNIVELTGDYYYFDKDANTYIATNEVINAGSYKVNYAISGSYGNNFILNELYRELEFEVYPFTATITVENIAGNQLVVTYNGEEQPVKAYITLPDGSTVNEADNFVITYNGESYIPKNAGVYYTTLLYKGDGKNIESTRLQIVYTIDRADAKLGYSNTKLDYNRDYQAIEIKNIPAEYINNYVILSQDEFDNLATIDDTFYIIYTGERYGDIIGKYKSTIRVYNQNYLETSYTATLEIVKAKVTDVEFEAVEVDFTIEGLKDELYPRIKDQKDYRITYSYYEYGEDGSETKVKFIDAGIYKVYAYVSGDNFLTTTFETTITIKAMEFNRNGVEESYTVTKTYNGKELEIRTELSGNDTILFIEGVRIANLNNLPDGNNDGTDGVNIKTQALDKYINAATYKVILTVEAKNYTPYTITIDLVVHPVKVAISYEGADTIKVGDELKIVAKYTDINGKVIEIPVKATVNKLNKPGDYKAKPVMGTKNYVPTDETAELNISVVEGPPIGGIVGGTLGGGVLVGGVITGVLLFIKRKRVVL